MFSEVIVVSFNVLLVRQFDNQACLEKKQVCVNFMWINDRHFQL